MSAIRTPKAGDHAKGWPKLLRDVAGLRVRLRRACSNGVMNIPAGTEGVLETSGNGWHLLRFRGDPCKCCGVSANISRMSWLSFDVITPAGRAALEQGLKKQVRPVSETLSAFTVMKDHFFPDDRPDDPPPEA